MPCNLPRFFAMEQDRELILFPIGNHPSLLRMFSVSSLPLLIENLARSFLSSVHPSDVSFPFRLNLIFFALLGHIANLSLSPFVFIFSGLPGAPDHLPNPVSSANLIGMHDEGKHISIRKQTPGFKLQRVFYN